MESPSVLAPNLASLRPGPVAFVQLPKGVAHHPLRHTHGGGNTWSPTRGRPTSDVAGLTIVRWLARKTNSFKRQLQVGDLVDASGRWFKVQPSPNN